MYSGDSNTLMSIIVEVELPKIVQKKMDPFVNAEDDYTILEELLKVGEENQTLSVSSTLAMQRTAEVVNLEMP